MNVLVTGANGFIGSSLVRYFLNLHYHVRGMVRKQSDLRLLDKSDCELIHGDITIPGTLKAAIRGMDIVIHTAGLSSDWGDRDDFTKSNVEGTKNMVVVSNERGIKRFVHLSSVAVHGFGIINGKEDGPTPVSHLAYSESKKEAEQWLNNFATHSSMEIVIVRPGNVYGPCDEKFIGPYLDFIKQGKFFYINGGKHLTCPTYIENLLYGIELACFREEARSQTFIITDGMYINWRTFTEALLNDLGLPLPRRSIPFFIAYATAYSLETIYSVFKSKKPPLLTRYRINNAGKNYHFSIEKASRFLGYRPKVDFNSAITQTINWYSKHRFIT